jgi:hypothetical protein
MTKEPLKDTMTVVQALEAAVKVLDEGNLKDQPLVEANIRSTIGSTLLSTRSPCLVGRCAAKRNTPNPNRVSNGVPPASHSNWKVTHFKFAAH